MLSYNNPIKETKEYSGLKIQELKPIMKLNLRGKKREFLSAVGKSLNMLLPTESNTSTSSENYTALWLSPDEWMLYSNNEMNENDNSYEVENELINNVSKVNLGAIIDVTDHFVLLKLSGEKIYELFSTGSPFNFNDFQNKNGAVTQTLLAKIDVIIHNIDKKNVNLFVRRSFSEHLFSWINDSASRL
ncbi:sarcosine oxidase subunit gamma [Candidatus Pelagibacter sp.]|uniref:sarcosine oxidase subunit gamma n=1 Tax=Candidatus Pelagibacter sp. TaxID=2024849 RepID=UPI003F85400A